MKICFKCKEEKSIYSFFKNKNSKDGLHASCKECQKNKNYDKVKRSEYYNDTKERDKEKNKERRKIHYFNNKEKENLNSKEYRIKNKDEIKKTSLEYYYNNKNSKEYKEKKSKYCRDRLKYDILYKIRHYITCMLGFHFRNNGFSKKSKTNEVLGCSFEDFKLYIENKFEYWMTWENRGLYNGELNYGWDIDHIIPISSAKTEEDIIRLNHYSNLQPLCSYVNRYVKRDTI